MKSLEDSILSTVGVRKALTFEVGKAPIFPESMAKGSSAGFTRVVLMSVITRCHCKESAS